MVLLMSPNLSTFSVPTGSSSARAPPLRPEASWQPWAPAVSWSSPTRGWCAPALVQPICGCLERPAWATPPSRTWRPTPAWKPWRRPWPPTDPRTAMPSWPWAAARPWTRPRPQASWPPTAATSATTRAWARCARPCRPSWPSPPPWAPAARSPTSTWSPTCSAGSRWPSPAPCWPPGSRCWTRCWWPTCRPAWWPPPPWTP